MAPPAAAAVVMVAVVDVEEAEAIIPGNCGVTTTEGIVANGMP
jgi:hypothetical protein